MSTRRLLLAALLCGMAILIAGGAAVRPDRAEVERRQKIRQASPPGRKVVRLGSPGVMTGLFDGYDPESFFDEAITGGGAPRPHYEALVRRLDGFTPHQLAERERVRDAAFRQAGHHLHRLRRGRGRRAHLPDGPRCPGSSRPTSGRTSRQGWSSGSRRSTASSTTSTSASRPRSRTASSRAGSSRVSDGFQREAFGIPVPHGARCLVAGIDLVRDAEGTYRVLEDNLRNPSGVSYVLENRAAMTRVLPARVRRPPRAPRRPLRPVAAQRPAARAARPAADPEPTVVVLTPGVFNSAYFEHAFLARQMGVELVEGRDLVVDDHVVSMRTTHGPQAGRRHLPPHRRRLPRPGGVPRPTRSSACPGCMSAARAGNVTHRQRGRQRRGRRQGRLRLRARPHPLLPRRGADPRRTSPTYLLWDTDQRDHVLEPARRAGGEAGGRVRRLRHADRAVGDRRGARGHAAPHRGRPARLHRPGGRARCRATRRWSTTTSRAATSTCGRSCSAATRSRSSPAGSPASRCARAASS